MPRNAEENTTGFSKIQSQVQSPEIEAETR